MNTQKTHENVPAWQKARELNKRVYRLCLRPPLSHDPQLCDQVHRLSELACMHIAQGFSASENETVNSETEVYANHAEVFARHLNMALDVTRELQSQLKRLSDSKSIDHASLNETSELCSETATQIEYCIENINTYLKQST